MDIGRVKYRDNMPYIETKNGKFIKKTYGKIIICKNCGKQNFTPNSQFKHGGGKFCSWKCSTHLKNNGRWIGGKRKHKAGYILIRNLKGNKSGYIFEHRLIIEKQIGRQLHRWEVVHHINGNPADNRINNLQLFKNNAEHKRIHGLLRYSKGALFGRNLVKKGA